MLKDENNPNSYTDNFIFWARKTEHLTDEEWGLAFKELERKTVADAGNGRESWPPSYAEFVVMAKKTISPNGMNSGAYIEYGTPDHPSYQRPAIADMGKKARLEKVKAETLTNLKGLLK